ncbi:MAG: hypothetical protein AB7T27_09425 [Kiritimatiellia bacterium]
MKSFEATILDLLGANDSVVVSTQTLDGMSIDPETFAREVEQERIKKNSDFTFEKIKVNPNNADEYAIRISKRK